MFYRIAEVTLNSQIILPSFAAFSCEAAEADVSLEITCKAPPEGGDEISCAGLAVRRIGGGWFFHAEGHDESGMVASGDYTRLQLINCGDRAVSGQDEWYIRVALECLLIHRGYVSLHAACVELDGEAIAFSGPSGMGKSTRAGRWVDTFGARLVSGDRPLLRADGSEVFGVPWDGKESCFRNLRLPLKAICEVRRSASVYVRKMTFEQRRRLLLRQCFLPMWDTDTAAVQLFNIVRLASRARIVRIFCGPGKDDAKALKQALYSQQECKEASDVKAKAGFILRHIMDEYMLMPTGENISKFNGTVLLNGVSAFLWEKLQSPVSREDLLTALLDEYEVDEATAVRDLDTLLEKLRDYGVIEDD